MARGLTPYTSTQENAWLVLASRALAKETLTLDLDGAPIKTALYRSYKAAEMAGKPIKITNTGDTPVQAVVSVSGSPITPEPAASNGFKIERNYFTLDGKPADVSKAKQNDRFAVVLKITEAKPEYGHIMVSDYLPAGLEIDNPHLVSSGDTGTLDWIEDGEEPENTEFRDDRFTAAIDRAANDKAVFTVAYVVRAVSPGKYVLPQAYVEDMYNPSRYGRYRHRLGRGASGEMSASTAITPVAHHERRWRTDQAGRGGVCCCRPDAGRRLRGVGRLARAVAAGAGPAGLHDDRRPQRQAVARLCDGGRPLAVAGRCQNRCRSRLPQAAAGLRRPALPFPCRRRSAGVGPRRVSTRHARPHRVRRLHHHDATGPADGAAAGAVGLCQVAPDGSRASKSSGN